MFVFIWGDPDVRWARGPAWLRLGSFSHCRRPHRRRLHPRHMHKRPHLRPQARLRVGAPCVTSREVAQTCTRRGGRWAMTDAEREAAEERAAIMEYDGGMSREEAEREAGIG